MYPSKVYCNGYGGVYVALIFSLSLGRDQVRHSRWLSTGKKFNINVVIFCRHNSWDYLIFAQRWPPAACLDLPHGKCKIPEDVDGWVIHGLWPTSIHGYPSFCNSSWKFTPKSVEPIAPLLRAKWPNLIQGSSTITFWRHEWVKHGTCAASLPELHGVLKYFVKSLELHENYNLYDTLRRSAVVPHDGEPYVLEFLERAIEITLGQKPKLFCRTHKAYKYPLLDTIYVCMDKNFELISCDISPEPPCNQTFVTYMPLPTSHHMVCPRVK